MRRLSGVVLAGAILMLPAFSQNAGVQAQAPQKLTMDGDLALWSVAIRPDKTGDFEKILGKIKEALTQVRRRPKPSSSWPAGEWSRCRSRCPTATSSTPTSSRPVAGCRLQHPAGAVRDVHGPGGAEGALRPVSRRVCRQPRHLERHGRRRPVEVARVAGCATSSHERATRSWLLSFSGAATPSVEGSTMTSKIERGRPALRPRGRCGRDRGGRRGARRRHRRSSRRPPGSARRSRCRPCRAPGRRQRSAPAPAGHRRPDVHGAGRAAVQHRAARQGRRLREAGRRRCATTLESSTDPAHPGAGQGLALLQGGRARARATRCSTCSSSIRSCPARTTASGACCRQGSTDRRRCRRSGSSIRAR